MSPAEIELANTAIRLGDVRVPPVGVTISSPYTVSLIVFGDAPSDFTLADRQKFCSVDWESLHKDLIAAWEFYVIISVPKHVPPFQEWRYFEEKET